MGGGSAPGPMNLSPRRCQLTPLAGECGAKDAKQVNKLALLVFVKPGEDVEFVGGVINGGGIDCPEAFLCEGDEHLTPDIEGGPR
jgi:hypothetical protein